MLAFTYLHRICHCQTLLLASHLAKTQHASAAPSLLHPLPGHVPPQAKHVVVDITAATAAKQQAARASGAHRRRHCGRRPPRSPRVVRGQQPVPVRASHRDLRVHSWPLLSTPGRGGGQAAAGTGQWVASELRDSLCAGDLSSRSTLPSSSYV